ncbi:MAG: hypothetical protein WBC51_12470 [Vicinamibacterales bacterium]
MIRLVFVIAAAACVSLLQPTASLQPYVVENLGRGLVALRTGDTSVYLGWRLLGTDPSNIAFNVYRATGPACRTIWND